MKCLLWVDIVQLGNKPQKGVYMCLNVWELRWIISLGFFSYGVWAQKILPLFFKLCLAFILTALGRPGCCSSDLSRQKLSSEGNQGQTVGLWSSMSVKSMAVSRRPKQELCGSHFGQVEKNVHCLPWDYQEMKIVPRNLPWVAGDSWGWFRLESACKLWPEVKQILWISRWAVYQI